MSKKPKAKTDSTTTRPRYKRWEGKDGKCSRCKRTIRKGDLVTAPTEGHGWIHASCPPRKGLSRPGEKTGSNTNTGGGPSNGRGSAQARRRAQNRGRFS